MTVGTVTSKLKEKMQASLGGTFEPVMRVGRRPTLDAGIEGICLTENHDHEERVDPATWWEEPELEEEEILAGRHGVVDEESSEELENCLEIMQCFPARLGALEHALYVVLMRLPNSNN